MKKILNSTLLLFTLSFTLSSKLLGGGESDTITFTVTEKSTYDFICSFPGYVSVMKGKLIVT